MGVNTLSKLKLESKLKKQTDFGDVSRINTLSKLIFQNNTLSKPKILAFKAALKMKCNSHKNLCGNI